MAVVFLRLDFSCPFICLTLVRFFLAVARGYYDIEEKLVQSQSELDQVAGFLDGVRAMNTSL